MKQRERSWGSIFWALSITLVTAQVALSFFFYTPRVQVLTDLGWLIFIPSIILGWLPIFVLRKKGGVEKGKSYVETQTLVDSGPYALVRHPQYLSWMLLNVALILVSQHWLILVVGLVSLVSVYGVVVTSDRDLVAKFGDDYKRYMEKVPRLNIVLGMVRFLQRSKEGQPS